MSIDISRYCYFHDPFTILFCPNIEQKCRTYKIRSCPDNILYNRLHSLPTLSSAMSQAQQCLKQGSSLLL